MNWMEVARRLVATNSVGTVWPHSREAFYAEEKMKTLFQEQESSGSAPSQSTRKSGARARIAVLIGILIILGLALWEGVAAALHATSGHS